jgi:hypothetical protein
VRGPASAEASPTAGLLLLRTTVEGAAGLIHRPPSRLEWPLKWPRLGGCAQPQSSERLGRLDQQNREPEQQLKPGGQRAAGAWLVRRWRQCHRRRRLHGCALAWQLDWLGCKPLRCQKGLQPQGRLRCHGTCRPGAFQGQDLELLSSGAFRERWDHPVCLPARTPAILG